MAELRKSELRKSELRKSELRKSPKADPPRTSWAPLAALIVVAGAVAGVVWHLLPKPPDDVEAGLVSPTDGKPRPLTPVSNSNVGDPPGVDDMIAMLTPSAFVSVASRLMQHWEPRYLAMTLEVARFSPPPQQAALYTMLNKLLPLEGVAASKDSKPPTHDDFLHWLWARDIAPHPDYAQFKAKLYAHVDPRFANYFRETDNARIRLDEVRWGGVRRDGIPPLKNPKMVTADQANWLADDHVVFGIEINGDARAYPKRILAWHEMFKDTVGGASIAGVYCTLCGAVIVYDTEHAGVHHELGTSGFLYRSNKLMYDHATESLWSTIEGEPVIGPLVGKGIKLTTRPVVTTTWGAWRERHPDTAVLSRLTGHARDYSEGAAYRHYFDNDRLMFTVPKLPTRRSSGARPLKNKDEVLALRFSDTDGDLQDDQGDQGETIAIAADFLAARPVYHGDFNGQPFVVLTDSSGANRVYATGDVRFTRFEGRTATDDTGRTWAVSEAALTAGNVTLRRLPAHRAFWFGWQAAHPDTQLITE